MIEQPDNIVPTFHIDWRETQPQQSLLAPRCTIQWAQVVERAEVCVLLEGAMAGCRWNPLPRLTRTAPTTWAFDQQLHFPTEVKGECLIHVLCQASLPLGEGRRVVRRCHGTTLRHQFDLRSSGEIVVGSSGSEIVLDTSADLFSSGRSIRIESDDSRVLVRHREGVLGAQKPAATGVAKSATVAPMHICSADVWRKSLQQAKLVASGGVRSVGVQPASRSKRPTVATPTNDQRTGDRQAVIETIRSPAWLFFVEGHCVGAGVLLDHRRLMTSALVGQRLADARVFRKSIVAHPFGLPQRSLDVRRLCAASRVPQGRLVELERYDRDLFQSLRPAPMPEKGRFSYLEVPQAEGVPEQSADITVATDDLEFQPISDGWLIAWPPDREAAPRPLEGSPVFTADGDSVLGLISFVRSNGNHVFLPCRTDA